MRRRWWVLALVAALVLAVPGAAWAKFTRLTSAGATYTTDTLAPPTAVSATKSCGLLGIGASITVTWTPTVDTYATGYQVVLTSGSTSTPSAVAGRTTTSTTISISALTTYTITVSATFRSWTSVGAPATTGSVYCSLLIN